MLKINLSRLLSEEKISTGNEMFKIDFPETKFLATWDKINFNTPF